MKLSLDNGPQYNALMRDDIALSILRRLIDSGQGGLSKAAAEAVLHLQLAQVDQDRMSELAGKSNQGRLTAEEGDEYDGYLAVADLLSLWKSKARFAITHRSSAA
jgi:uncharacterized secreted protein with C-terminal beta-propeller domain